MTARINAKRAYEKATARDGVRILVDRLWPRGVSKSAAKIDYWAKDTAPSNELRRWYGHDPEKWNEFRRRYFAELDANAEAVSDLRARIGRRAVTFVFASKEALLNDATALREYLARPG